MIATMPFKVGATFTAPVSAILPVTPTLLTDCAKCEGNINLGLFFDGTNNNMERDSKDFGDSNVARLYNTYLAQKEHGYYRRYIPGVGTPFPEIGEAGESSLGSGFAIGCEQRVLYALLWVFNAIHRSAFNEQVFFNDAQVAALCRCQSRNSSIVRIDDQAALASMGLENGLRIPDTIGDGMRVAILKDQAGKLQKKLVKGRPVIRECFIDIFGFSRGAAEARVFCHWLNDILVDGKLAGIVVHFRFVGLMDTVASAGFWSSVVATVTGLNGGHSGWADARFLRIPASVKNCVHMVSMHELRKNFPLDTVSVDEGLPKNCQEFAYPGTHSDVGGGYKPGELGISVGKDAHQGDALKLAQIPLNHMFDCAVAAGAPMLKLRASDKTRAFDPFAIDTSVQKAYDDFLSHATLKPRHVHEWLQPYLSWRWEVRTRFATLNHVRQANKGDFELLKKFNEYLLADADLILTKRSLLDLSAPFLHGLDIMQSVSRATLDDEAPAVLASAQLDAPAAPALHTMFDFFVHDSLAGFNKHALELTGYWRYRKGFLGNSKRMIAETEDGANADKTATTG